MPRKKSVGGRARGVTAVNRLMIQTERINKQLKRLEQAKRYGTYKSKELIRFVQQTPQLSIKKSRGSKRHRVVVNKIKMTTQQYRLIDKQLRSILKSEAFYVTGIDRIENRIKTKIKESLGETLDRKVTKADLEKFYNVIAAKQVAKKNTLLDQLDPSLFMKLTDIAVEKRMSEDTFIKTLSTYEDLNNETDRKQAQYLYNKYVKPLM